MIEPLELRRLLSSAPIGPAVAVADSSATGASSVATMPDGSFVVAWSGQGVGGDLDIFARRYDASGAPLGGALLVNATTTGDQITPSIAADDAGEFVVTWQTRSGHSQGRLFNADGSARGAEFYIGLGASEPWLLRWSPWRREGRSWLPTRGVGPSGLSGTRRRGARSVLR